MIKYVTFSRNVFIPITNVCRNACAYCGFRARSEKDAYITPVERFMAIIKSVRGRATEALFTAGERPELANTRFGDWIRRTTGFSSIVPYTKELCKLAIMEGLLPHCNIGILSYDELEELRPLNASMGLMLETTAEVEAHRYSPGKTPELRLEMIARAGELKIPFTTGLLIGIGENPEDRINALEILKSLYDEYRHIQEVIIQPFVPKPYTPMSNAKPPEFEVMKDTVRTARAILPDEVAIQVPPNLTSPRELIELGASDLGGISEMTIDYINPESPWPTEAELREAIAPFVLRERLPIYPRFIKQGWYSKEIRPLIEQYADEDGLRKRTESSTYINTT